MKTNLWNEIVIKDYYYARWRSGREMPGNTDHTDIWRFHKRPWPVTVRCSWDRYIQFHCCYSPGRWTTALLTKTQTNISQIVIHRAPNLHTQMIVRKKLKKMKIFHKKIGKIFKKNWKNWKKFQKKLKISKKTVKKFKNWKKLKIL